MSPDHIIRSWKDADFSPCLDPDAANSVPANPVGPMGIADGALGLAGGYVAMSTEYLETLGCCQGFTQAGKCDVTAGFPYCTGFCLTIVFSRADLC